MLTKYTEQEIIAGLRAALKRYANPNNWADNKFLDLTDKNRDDCSGLFHNNGEIARQALQLYNESALHAS